MNVFWCITVTAEAEVSSSYSSLIPALGCAESPDNRLKSSSTEAAEVGAEDTEVVALLAAGGADGPEMRPRRESSAVMESATEQRAKFSHRDIE